jgi:hypothetical protein
MLTRSSEIANQTSSAIIAPRRLRSPDSFYIHRVAPHSDLDALLERAYPRYDGGRLGRRDVLKSAMTGACLPLVGLSVACSAEDTEHAARIACNFVDSDVGRFLIELFQILATAFGVGLGIPTNTTFLNDTGDTLSIKMAVDLVKEAGCGWVKGRESDVLDIPPGKHVVEFNGEGVEPDEPGDHHLDNSASGSAQSSSVFNVL